jgi:hypothetical protein
MHIFYKYSDKGKPPRLNNNIIDKKYLFDNFVKCNGGRIDNISVLLDNSTDNTYNCFKQSYDALKITRSSLGNCGANMAIYNTICKKMHDDEIVFITEDDYLYLPDLEKYIIEGISIADYVTLYDHPDKYMNPSPNPYVYNGGEQTKVFCTRSSHWKFTNSTTMTFAMKAKTLKQDFAIFTQANQGSGLPEDFKMWCELIKRGRTLVSPIPSRATHLDGINHSLLIDWYKI